MASYYTVIYQRPDICDEIKLKVRQEFKRKKGTHKIVIYS